MVSSTLPELAGSPGREIRRSCLWFRQCDSCVPRNPAFGLALHPVPRFGAAVCLEVLTGAPIPLLLVLVPAVVLLAIGVPATGSVTPSSLFSAQRSCSGLSLPSRVRERGARVAFSRGSFPAGRRRPPWAEGSLCVPRRGSMLPSPTAGPPSSSPPDRLAERSPWKGQGKREVLALPWGPS